MLFFFFILYYHIIILLVLIQCKWNWAECGTIGPYFVEPPCLGEPPDLGEPPFLGEPPDLGEPQGLGLPPGPGHNWSSFRTQTSNGSSSCFVSIEPEETVLKHDEALNADAQRLSLHISAGTPITTPAQRRGDRPGEGSAVCVGGGWYLRNSPKITRFPNSVQLIEQRPRGGEDWNVSRKTQQNLRVLT